MAKKSLASFVNLYKKKNKIAKMKMPKSPKAKKLSLPSFKIRKVTFK